MTTPTDAARSTVRELADWCRAHGVQPDDLIRVWLVESGYPLPPDPAVGPDQETRP